MDAARNKIVLRARNLISLANSPNRNEARLARERADELILKHVILKEELDAFSVGEPSFRCAGPLVECYAGKRRGPRENVAFLVAKQFKCKAFKARGKLFFRGTNAVDAVVFYKTFIGKFSQLDGFLFGNFKLRDGLVSYSDNRPGQYATMFVNGEKLPFRGDLSEFDNSARRYTWVFEDLHGKAVTGTHLVFATFEFEVVAEMREHSATIVARSARVAKGANGEPMHVEESRWIL